MILLKLFFWLVFIYGTGFFVIKMLSDRSSRVLTLEQLGLIFPLGCGVISLYMVILSLFHISFSVSSFIGLWIPLLLLLMWLKRLEPGVIFLPQKITSLTFLEKFLLAVILIQTIYVFLRALIIPMEAFDSILNFGMRAKVFYFNQGIPANYFSEFKDVIYNIEYPLLLSLTETCGYIFLGQFHDGLIKIIFPLYYLSILMFTFGFFRRFFSRENSLLFLFFLATVPQFVEFATNGYAEILVSFYFTVSAFYIILWMTTKKPEALIVSAVCCALMLWTKTEGLMLICANIALVIVYGILEKSSHWRTLLKYIAFCSLLLMLYWVVIHAMGVNVHGMFKAQKNPPHLWEYLSRTGPILYEYQMHIFGPKKWNLIWILWIGLVIFRLKRSWEVGVRYVTMLLGTVFLGYFIVFMMADSYEWVLEKTASRFILHFLPLLVYHGALLFSET